MYQVRQFLSTKRCTNTGNITLDFDENMPIERTRNIPSSLLEQCNVGFYRRRRYTKAHEIEKLAVEKYNKNGKGITFHDILSAGRASNKKQSQITLKHYLNKGILFTISAHKPQRYYPASIKSEILKSKMEKNMPIGVTGVGYYSKEPRSSDTNSNSCDERIAIQPLEDYVLPLLPSAPLHIHKMQFKLKIDPECYTELDLSIDKGNHGKEHLEIIGKVRTSYRFYGNGTVMVFTESSNSPFKLEDETDRSRLIAFFGQVRDRLVTFLMDTHERIVPDIMQWEMTDCDINRDVKVSNLFQVKSIKVQVKHYDHLFRVYIKSRGNDTVCRVEESFSYYPTKPSAIEAINGIFNPLGRVENLITDLGMRLDKMMCAVNNGKEDSIYDQDLLDRSSRN